MSDGEALLAAICANPDEDTPRLVYADWLDENGRHKHAELIRLQIALATDWMPTAWSLENRRKYGRHQTVMGTQRKLFRAVFKEEFGTSLGGLGSSGATTSGYAHQSLGDSVIVGACRGFIHLIRCPASTWIFHGDAIRQRHPVERVYFTSGPDVTHTRANDPYRLYFTDEADELGDACWCLTDDDLRWLRRPDESSADVMLRVRWPGIKFEYR